MRIRSPQRRELLATAEPFSHLGGATLETLMDHFVEHEYARRDLIFRQGDPGDALLLVAQGVVRVFVVSDQGSEMGLATLDRGQVFGELALVDGGPRSASAQALVPTTLLALPRTTFLELRREHEAVAAWLERWMATLIRRSVAHAADLLFLDLHGRVAKALLELVPDDQADRDDVPIDLHMTQSDLASLVGGSRQSVNQILRAFENRGYLEIEGRRIVLKRPDLLRRRAGL
ncbi:MAG: Crp/Fnr family transcriptional regulator [Actinomycetota bacterium]